ncbi:hypothetical protein GCWU000325_01375 [Alloprevotella tannerae ATCC 51259]|uniref:Uncharacterized protein n=1 Tax=Alloprevotella tannerae ATCC 51259 TaxID=626522 RepID=C9LGN1_9BACT|nr:hypothetical protein GCWU000325_01375 [Alloprevotella tannerae ATCC 51259]
MILISTKDEWANFFCGILSRHCTKRHKKCFFFAEKRANAVSKASLNLSFYTATRPKLTIILQELCNFYAQS